MSARKPPTGPATVVEVENLTILRDDAVILDGVNWRVLSGRHWALIGANGSGKTSLLSALTGYLMPTAGEITVLGERYGESDWPELRKRIGLVSSSIRRRIPGWEPALDTVISGSSAMLGLWGRVRRADRAAASDWLERMGCAHLAKRAWQVISQGERQRVLIARALMARPALLILDEPCAGLDPVAREGFLQFLENLARSENAPGMVLVTHHIEEITSAFSEVLVLRQGRVLASGPCSRTLTGPILSAAFDAEMHVRKHRGRFRLEMKPS